MFQKTINEENNRLAQTTKKWGALAFLFFLIKGLAWIIVPYVLYLLGSE